MTTPLMVAIAAAVAIFAFPLVFIGTFLLIHHKPPGASPPRYERSAVYVDTRPDSHIRRDGGDDSDR